ncbi:DUF2268 domain-containing protein [Fredinandcohnia humi]
MIKRLVTILMFAISSVLLISCTNKTMDDFERPKDLDIKDFFIVKNGKQEFKIIPFYSHILEYVESASKVGNIERLEDYYYQSVIEPFQLDTLGKGEGYWLKDSWAFATPKNIKTLEEFVYSLINNQDKINQKIEQALIKSSNSLSGENKTVYLFPPNPDNMFGIDQLGGVAGLTISKDIILIQIDPISYNDNKILEYTVAHEYHHSIYMESGEVGTYNTLLDSMILEGKADTFAKSLYPNINIPWIEPLSAQKEKEVWDDLEKNLMSIDQAIIDDYHNGNSIKGIPTWSKNKIGYQIMNSFLENNPTTSIHDWTKLSGEEILLNSKYSDKISK